MVTTLAKENLAKKNSQELPFAMSFAVKPTYVLSEISSQVLESKLGYNPKTQMNEATELNISMGSSTCTVEGSVSTGSFSTDSQPDTQSDD